jgi:hypothetical protein
VNRAARVGLLASVVVTAIGTFLPFARSGERSRSSYELVSLARRLELVPERWPGVATRLWFAVPLLLALCWILVVTGRATAGSWCALAVSVIALGALIAVWRSPLAATAGWIVTAVGAVGLASCSAVVLCTRERGGR